MAKKTPANRMTAREILAHKQAQELELDKAKAFGRACRREHEALGKLLVMLDHIVGMPTIPEVIAEARAAFATVQIKVPRPDGSVEVGGPEGFWRRDL